MLSIHLPILTIVGLRLCWLTIDGLWTARTATVSWLDNDIFVHLFIHNSHNFINNWGSNVCLFQYHVFPYFHNGDIKVKGQRLLPSEQFIIQFSFSYFALLHCSITVAVWWRFFGPGYMCWWHVMTGATSGAGSAYYSRDTWLHP